MTKNTVIVILTAGFYFFGGNAIGSEYRCADKIISIGDARSELGLRCGEPDWKETRTEELIVDQEKDKKRKTVILLENWTYNLGPDRFMRIFTLRDNKIVEIQTGGYGFAKDQPQPSGCGDRVISVGDLAVDVIAKCGEPVWKDKREEIIKERLDENSVRKMGVTIEEWTYDFGPNSFRRIFTLRNGKVSDIRTGGYGAERK